MRFKIGSFNVQNMGRRTTDEKKKLIAKIISDENFDIVAFQEVLSEGQAIDSMKEKYFPSWECRWAKPKESTDISKDINYRGDRRGEGFAYLWNPKRLRLASSEKRIYEPRILNDNEMRFDNSIFARTPYYIRFEPVNGGFFEFRFINVHLHFGKDTDSEVEKRKKEYEYLVNNIYPSISLNRKYGNNREAYTIIMGDYNLNLRKDRGAAVDWIKEKTIIDRETLIGNQVIMTIQDELTSLKSNQDEISSNKKIRGYSQNYDHFTLDVKVLEEEGIRYRTKRIDAVRKYKNDDFEEYLAEISDHIPISLELIMNEPDMLISHQLIKGVIHE